jgi:hypothetical protein
MDMRLQALLFGVLAALFLVTVALQLAGYRIGQRHRKHPERPSEGTAAVEGAIFALLGLLIAFTFSGTQDRLAYRRTLIVREADAIGTAYLRLDLLPSEAQPMLRAEMRHYVDSRIAYYGKLLDFDAAEKEHQRTAQLQNQIWQDAVLAAAETGDPTASLILLPALNEMFDVTTDREAALRTHTPLAIYGLLAVLGLSCAFVAGMGMWKRATPSRLHIIMFAGALSLTGYVILNLEYPRIGFARLDSMDALLYQARAAMD